ncbi:MAG: glycosyltransferase [Patescibacteria group bacterium]|nr:glycosyltransferase [Patescibacteria group bacterium]
MKIGIDISQIAYRETGVGEYVKNLVSALIEYDRKNEYILFFSSLRKNFQFSPAQRDNFQSNYKNIKVKKFRFPPTFLDLLWNRLHIFPIEWFIGDIDLFITSDWLEPPTKKAKKATIIYDMIVYKYPRETDSKIIATQKRKLKWVKKESDIVFCISKSTKRDIEEILGIEDDKIRVIYPGA